MAITAALDRKKPFPLAAVVSLLLLSTSICMTAFSSPSRVSVQETTADDVERVRTDLVTIPAFVTDSKGRRVLGLSAIDFEVRDDGRSVKIDFFATGTDNVALMFALDASGSIRQVIRQQRETALGLFARFGSRSRVAVMRFTENAELVAPFSNAPEQALKAFEGPPLRDRRTAIFDSTLSAIQAFDARRADPTERRIVILISDGLDTVSTARSREVIEQAARKTVSIYVIHIPLFIPRDGRLVQRPAAKGFRDLAEKTGGRYFVAGDAASALNPNSSINLEPILTDIELDLRGQYLLGYYPSQSEPDGRFHKIELRLTDKEKRKLRVRSLRDGYTLSK
jgi:Ca-activated chloride channel family protein